jgi:hypothetical protein
MNVRDDTIKQIRKKYEALKSVFDERSRRQWAATEAEQYGRGGLARVCEATGMFHNTVKKGVIEIAARENEKDTGMENKRIRREGGGRKKLTDKNANLADDLNIIGNPPALPGDSKKFDFCGSIKSFQLYPVLDAVTRDKKMYPI